MGSKRRRGNAAAKLPTPAETSPAWADREVKAGDFVVTPLGTDPSSDEPAVTGLEGGGLVVVFPPEVQLAQLAAAAMCSVRTVRRWYEAPHRTDFGNRARLRSAATRLGIAHPRHPEGIKS